MKDIFHQLINLDSNLVTVVLLGSIYTLEQLINRPVDMKKSGRHFLHGIPLQVGYLAVSYALAFVFVSVVNWVHDKQLGIFNQFHLPFWLKLIIGLLCIDLVFYWTHRLAHNWSLVWRLHRVHHSDTYLAGASFLRFHPLDALLDTMSALFAAVVFGLDMDILLFFFLVNLLVNVLQHSRFSFPRWTDTIFGKIFATPNLHKVHHHQEQLYTDSNYGLIFIIWDRLFGTYQELPVEEIRFGLAEFDEPRKQDAWYLLKSPFLKIERKKE